MLQHVEAGRRTEIEALNGALIREAQALGIPTPNNEALVALLKGRELHQQRAHPRARSRLRRPRRSAHQAAGKGYAARATCRLDRRRPPA